MGGEIFSVTSAASVLKVRGSISAKSGVDPACRMTFTLAMKVSEGPMTSSPGPIRGMQHKEGRSSR